MPKFGETSTNNLNSAVPELQEIFREVVKRYDCSVTCGFRGRDAQNQAFENGNSRTKFPHGKHNRLPSEAVDAPPYPIDWNNKKRFYHFAGYVMRVAEDLGHEIRWGGDWDSDLDLDDQKFFDLVHWEYIGPLKDELKGK
jgi:peptidoglycan L-alanyl-D-glutamate endopeptidase CwlK